MTTAPCDSSLESAMEEGIGGALRWTSDRMAKVELRDFNLAPRGPDDRVETTAARASVEGRRRRLPAHRCGGSGAAVDGDRRGRADRRWTACALRRPHDLSQRVS